MSWSHAASTLPCSWYAWHLLTVRLLAGCKIQRGGTVETLLVWGSGGGCGLDAMVVQLASRVLGLTCHVITPTARAAMFRSIGAARVYPVEPGDGAGLGAALRSVIDSTDERGVDHALVFDDASPVDVSLTPRWGGNVVLFGEMAGSAHIASRGLTVHCMHPPVLVQEDRTALAAAAAAVNALFRPLGAPVPGWCSALNPDAADLPGGLLVALPTDLVPSDQLLDAVVAVTADQVRVRLTLVVEESVVRWYLCLFVMYISCC